MRRSKKGSNVDPTKFEGPGVDFKSKLIGIAEVSAPRGDEICQDAITELKAEAIKNNKEKKEHKQKIVVNITLKGIRLIDETTERIDYAHPIHRISFISHDKSDKRTFGYIVGTKDGYKLFAIKSIKEAEAITATLKELFQEVYKRHEAKKREEGEEEDEPDGDEEKKSEEDNKANDQIEVAEEAIESVNKEGVDSQLVGELNKQIEEMANVIPHSSSFDMLDDPFIGVRRTETAESTGERSDPFDDNFAPVAVQKEVDLFGDIENEKIDFVALPHPDEIMKNKITPTNTPSNNLLSANTNNDLLSVEALPPPAGSTLFSADLFDMPTPPPRKQTAEGEEALMKHDPFEEMKKNINELHKQNMMVQQQQQQHQMGFHPTFPTHMTQQGPAAINPYAPNIPNPFMANNGFANNPPPVPARPSPPVVPARPGTTATNPFLSQQQLPNQVNADPMGWTVLDTTPTVKTEVVKKDPFASDPFSFLDEKPSMMVNSISVPANTNSHLGANKELLDLLG